MKIRKLLKKLNIFEKKTTIFVCNNVYDKVAEILNQMGIDYKLKYAEIRYYKSADVEQVWYEIDIRCTLEEYRYFHEYLEKAQCRSDMGFAGYGVCCN